MEGARGWVVGCVGMEVGGWVVWLLTGILIGNMLRPALVQQYG
jgi:hypothetical protein